MEKWNQRWEHNQLRWHKTDVDPFLQKYLEKITENECTADIASKTFFVPLCGKTLDIAYILRLGYKVFAVEGVRLAIERLNMENEFGLEFCEEDTIFRSPDRRLQIYLGDLFTCPIEKWAPFDYVWDKGSLTAIDEDCRESYIHILRKSVQFPGKVNEYGTFNYLLRTVQYDKSNWDGKGPKCVSDTDMEKLYGDWANITLLESVPLPITHICRRNIDVGLICHENVYLLQNKL